LPASKKSYFMCAPLGSAFSNALKKSKSKTAASNLSTILENRYTNFRQECGHAQMQRLNADPSRFFCDDIAKRIYSGNINQRGMGKKGAVPIKGFSLLHIALLHSDTLMGLSHSPSWGKNGFATYDAVESVFHAIKWFLMTIFHPQWYKHTVIFNGICYLEEQCEARNFRTSWADEDFNSRAASYRLVLAMHDIMGITAALANHLPIESVLPAFYTIEDDAELFPCQLVPSIIDESGYSALPHKDLHAWYTPLQADLDRCGRNSSCFSASLDPAPVIDHPLFESLHSKNNGSSPFLPGTSPPHRKRESQNSDDKSPPAKRKATDKPQKAPASTAILQLTEGKIVSDVLSEASSQKTKFTWQLKKGKELKGMRPMCRLCFTYLIGQECTADKCGYHLSLDSRMTTTVKDWSSFKSWVKQLSDYVTFTSEAKQHPAFKPSSEE
jgi:hypothetical protein